MATTHPRRDPAVPASGDAPFLSVVIPAHDEERRLPATLDRTFAFLDTQPYAAEVVVVENASRDRTFEISAARAESEPRLRVLREPTRGKGAAVRRGMLAARGEHRIFCDADLSMPIEEVPRFLRAESAAADVIVASREAAGAVRYQEPGYRHLMGRVFNTLVRLALLPGLHDTQCGFKCFRAPAAEAIFRRVTRVGFGFDVETLVIARRLGFRVEEIPVPWHYDADSRVRMFRDSFAMIFDLAAVAWNRLRGRYDAGT